MKGKWQMQNIVQNYIGKTSQMKKIWSNDINKNNNGKIDVCFTDYTID